jgi:hypothetical protein
MLRTHARLLTVILLILSAAAFTAAVIAERATTTETHASPGRVPAAAAQQPSISPAGTGHHDSGESATPAPSGETASPAGHSEPAAPGETSSGATREVHAETLLGINPEATPLVVIAVLLSLLLAAAVLGVSSPLLLTSAALAMLAFAALDIREVTHQLNESRPGLAALAAAVALLHLLAAAAALTARRTAPPRRGTPDHAPAQ